MKRLKVYGEKMQSVRLFGNPAKQNEPYEFRIDFPGGYVSVSRTSDNEYWIHFGTSNDLTDKGIPSDAYRVVGEIKDARIDQTGKASDAADLGDLMRKEVNHVALLIGKKKD